MTTVAARSDATCVPLSRKHLFVIAPGNALVEMKQEPPSLLWQTVFVRSDGTGLVTTLDGEITGAHEAPFKLTPARFALLRRLIADTRPPHRKLPIGTHSGYVYLIHTRGQPDVATDARTPTRYGGLARFLDQLMFTYSC